MSYTTNLLDSFSGKHVWLVLPYAHAVFDSNAHATECSRPALVVVDVDTSGSMSALLI